MISYFHGDYDGDECHLYVLGCEGSIEEAALWTPPLDENLREASGYMTGLFPQVYGDRAPERDLEFLKYTTLTCLSCDFSEQMVNLVTWSKGRRCAP